MSKLTRRRKVRVAAKFEQMKSFGEPMVADKILKYIDNMSLDEREAVNLLDFDERIEWFNKIINEK